MDFDLTIDNYSKDDYFEIFDLDKNMNPTKKEIEKKVIIIVNNFENEDMTLDDKEDMKLFLLGCRNNLLVILNDSLMIINVI